MIDNIYLISELIQNDEHEIQINTVTSTKINGQSDHEDSENIHILGVRRRIHRQ